MKGPVSITWNGGQSTLEGSTRHMCIATFAPDNENVGKQMVQIPFEVLEAFVSLLKEKP